MARAVFRILYQPGRMLRNGRSQSYRLQRRIAWLFWSDIGWFEFAEDAQHYITAEVRQRRQRRVPSHIVAFDADGQELT
ncbi:hypothetical protein [Burkholderia ubonensis]|uniref:hypothetical protein n=1 Tax=Burkholderia ubonensis TaxID=101571 RepID=UPI00075F49AF|nr:hypothetical protein [Burkholderia ubonensis]KVU67089.1 hypothetical protein WK71_01370 [Burkholderia ubonensis]